MYVIFLKEIGTDFRDLYCENLRYFMILKLKFYVGFKANYKKKGFFGSFFVQKALFPCYFKYTIFNNTLGRLYDTL